MAKFEFNEWIVAWLLSQNFFKFQWDVGNSTKNQDKHGITCEEAESVFNNIHALKALGTQISPVVNETRYGAFGMTDEGKPIFICFTIKENTFVRIISIRKLNRKEVSIYEEICEK